MNYSINGICGFFDCFINGNPHSQTLKNSLKYIKFSGCNICNENNIVLLNDFDIRDSFDPRKEKNIITGDHIDRGPHSTEVLCMELQVKEKLREKLKKEKEKKEELNDDNSNENKIIEEKEDDDKKISEGEDGLVLVRGDHELGCYGRGAAGNMPSENELAANLLAKEMITNGQLVPDYLHETNNKNIESHSHVMFLVPHVFQVFRQIDELIELNRIINDINVNDFFTKHRDNEFVKILIGYSETTEYGKIILQSLVETYKNALKNKKYKEILGKLGVTGENKNNINKISDLIAKYKNKFYRDWDSCVDAGYDFYEEVKKEFDLSTKDFFKLRSFAMDVFTSPIVNKEETKKKLISKLACGDMESYYSIAISSTDLNGEKKSGSVDVSKFKELLDCFADYFSNSDKGFCCNQKDVTMGNPYFQIDSCLKSLRIIKFKRNDGYASNMYFERKLVKDLDDAWRIENEPESAKLTFPNVIQFAGHDRNKNHEIEIYDKSVVNNDPASSIGYSTQFSNEKKSNLYPSKFVYNSECPENANLVRCNVMRANTTNPGVDNYPVESVYLNFWKEDEIKKEIENENKKEKKVKIKIKNEIINKNEIKTEKEKEGEENEIINKSDIMEEKFIAIKDKNEKEKESEIINKNDIKIKDKNEIKGEIKKIENKNKKEKKVKIKIKNEIINKNEIKTEKEKEGEENEIINKSDIMEEKFIAIKDKTEKEKESEIINKNDIKIKDKNEIKGEIKKIENKNKKEKKVKIKIKNEIINKNEIKTEKEKEGEENEIINKSDIMEEKFIAIKDKTEKEKESEIINKNEIKINDKNDIINENEKEKEIIEIKDKNELKDEKENKTGGTYLMKWILIILGLCFIGGGIALFFVAPTLAVKLIAIGLGIVGVAGFGFGLLYNGIVERYCKESESCCFGFWPYTTFEPKQKNEEKNEENDINLKKEEEEKKKDNLIKD